MPLLALNDEELAALMDGARPLPPQDRDKFLRDVAAELAKHPEELGLDVVHRLVRDVQRKYFDAGLVSPTR